MNGNGITTIGINGRVKSGKDTVASIIQLVTWQDVMKGQVTDKMILGILGDKEALKMVNYIAETPWRIAKYSMNLKIIGTYLTGLKVDDFEDHKTKSDLFYNVTTGQLAWREELLGAYGVYPAALLIEEVQDSYPEGSWISIRVFLQDLGTQALRARWSNIWVNSLWATHKEPDYWLITDTRFVNEATRIKREGGMVIRVSRPGHDDMSSTHESEVGLDSWDFDKIILNDGTLQDLVIQVRGFLAQYGFIHNLNIPTGHLILEKPDKELSIQKAAA